MTNLVESNLNTTFIIDGGAGRLITAIPALERFAIENPDDDFRVLTAAWEELYWSHPVLQSRTFNVNQKGAFELHMKDRKIVRPEPYLVHGYYNQKLHMIEAFHTEINRSTDYTVLDKPNLYISNNERAKIRSILKEILEEKKKKKTLVIQPYGSGIAIQNGRPVDTSNRSFDVDIALKLIYNLSKDYAVIYFGPEEFYHPGDTYSATFFQANPDLRMYMAAIAECDYFVGVDSVGQHIARAFNKPGTVILGSTFEENVSYKDHFTIYRNAFKPVYAPIRLSGIDCEFAETLNERTMDYTEKDVEKILKCIKKN